MKHTSNGSIESQNMIDEEKLFCQNNNDEMKLLDYNEITSRNLRDHDNSHNDNKIEEVRKAEHRYPSSFALDIASSYDDDDTKSTSIGSEIILFDDDDDDENELFRKKNESRQIQKYSMFRLPTMREMALLLSLYVNILILLAKLITYIRTLSLSVLAALLDSILDVISQLVLNYTEKQSSLHRSSKNYPAGASRLEPIGVLICAGLMLMASFDVLKEGIVQIISHNVTNESIDVHDTKTMLDSFCSMFAIVIVKLLLLWLCRLGARKHQPMSLKTSPENHHDNFDQDYDDIERQCHLDTSFRSKRNAPYTPEKREKKPLLKVDQDHVPHPNHHDDTTELISNVTPSTSPTTPGSELHTEEEESMMLDEDASTTEGAKKITTKVTEESRNGTMDTENGDVGNTPTITSITSSDPTLEALAQDHLNDCLSNTVAAVALLFIWHTDNRLWYLDPIGAIVISFYIIYSWYMTGSEQVDQLVGISAPDEFIDEIREIATNFDASRRFEVNVLRAYHFGPKFLVEIKIIMAETTLLRESYDMGMGLQYEIESLPDVERCFVQVDYEARSYDEHVVSQIPELMEKHRPTIVGRVGHC